MVGGRVYSRRIRLDSAASVACASRALTPRSLVCSLLSLLLVLKLRRASYGASVLWRRLYQTPAGRISTVIMARRCLVPVYGRQHSTAKLSLFRNRLPGWRGRWFSARLGRCKGDACARRCVAQGSYRRLRRSYATGNSCRRGNGIGFKIYGFP